MLRVAYTLEQCWHPVPGGTAVATLAVAGHLARRDDVELVGVAGRHRNPPRPSYEPPVDVRQLALARPWLYEAWNRFERPRVERATGPVDVCHSTTSIPAATKSPHVVTVHDVAFLRAPERHSRHGVRVMRAGLERCRRAELVLCPTAAVADDLLTLEFEADRIRVVPWGVEQIPVTPDDIRRVGDRYLLPERFVVFVGTIEPRKNLARLADAVGALDDVPLVVVGADGWGDVRVHGDVRFTGFVPTADRAAIVSAAAALAYPSLEEGFGLPILEAMAQGTPVVTSRGSATEEVAAGAAVLVDPFDVESIRTGLDTALTTPDGYIGAGRERAAAMTWDASADATVDAYLDVAR